MTLTSFPLVTADEPVCFVWRSSTINCPRFFIMSILIKYPCAFVNVFYVMTLLSCFGVSFVRGWPRHLCMIFPVYEKALSLRFLLQSLQFKGCPIDAPPLRPVVLAGQLAGSWVYCGPFDLTRPVLNPCSFGGTNLNESSSLTYIICRH